MFKTKAEKENEKREIARKEELCERRNEKNIYLREICDKIYLIVKEILASQQLIELLPAGDKKDEEIEYCNIQKDFLLLYMDKYNSLVEEYNKFIIEEFDPDAEHSDYLKTVNIQELIRSYLKHFIIKK